MPAPKPDKMPETSKIIVYGMEFQDAMKAALAVAGNTEPFDIIQLRINPNGGDLMICAREGSHDIAVTMSVSTEMVDVVDDRDEVIEITKSDARALSAMKVKKAKKNDDDEDEPKVGLIIAEQSITRTDESGLGIGIRMSRVRRATWPGEKLALGDVDDMLSAAGDSMPGESSALTAHQLRTFGTVAAALDVDLSMWPMEPAGDFESRTYLTGTGIRGFAARAKQPAEKPDGEKDPLSFNDAEDPIEKAKKAFRDANGTVHLVSATPPKGIA